MSIIGGYQKHGFDAYGEKVLKAEHMSLWMDSPLRVDPEGVSFEIGAGIEEVEDGFFLLLPTIRELFLLSPNCNIIMSEETLRLFQANQVLIRGDYDGAAEVFAQKCGLRFLHRDVVIAKNGDYSSPGGTDIVSICFREDGTAYLCQENHCIYGDGEKHTELPGDYYLGCAEQIANHCLSKACAESIIADGALSDLLEKAKRKGGFFVDYSGACNK